MQTHSYVESTWFLEATIPEKLEERVTNLKQNISVNKIIYSILFLFLLASFAHREPSYCRIVDQITNSYLKEMAIPHGLVLSGYGGAMMDDVQSITLRFLSHDSLNLNEARVLYVEMMEDFLHRVNCHEKIRPHLHDFPFGVDNIKLTISFEDPQGNIRGNGYIAMIFISKNHTIHYSAYNSNKEDFYNLCEESYGEARRKVTGQ